MSPVPGRGKGALSVYLPPGAPTAVSAAGRDASAIVSFTAPAPNGGTPITSYTVTASPGGASASGASSPITVPGLTNLTGYTFTVKATNSSGPSVASAASSSISPHKQTKTVSYPGEAPEQLNGSDDVITFSTVNADWYVPTGLSPSVHHIAVTDAGSYRIQFGANFPSATYAGFGHGWTGTRGNVETWMNVWRSGAWVYATSGGSRLGLTSNWFSDPFFQGIDQTITLQAGDQIVIFGNHGATGNGMKPWDASLSITMQ